jgi:hypothetical protein
MLIIYVMAGAPSSLSCVPTNGQVQEATGCREPLGSEPALLHGGVHNKWRSLKEFAVSRELQWLQ